MSNASYTPRKVNRSLSQFVFAWLRSFPWRSFLASLPFLFVSLFFANLFSGPGEETRSPQFLKIQLSKAIADEDFETARLVLQRHLQANTKDPEARLQMAQVLDLLGRREEAVRMMRALAFPEVESLSFIEPALEMATNLASEEGAAEMAEILADPNRPTDRSEAIRRRFRTADPRAAHWLVAKHFIPQLETGMADADRADFMDLLDWLYLLSPRDVELAKLYVTQLIRVKRFNESLPVLVQLMPLAPGVGLQAAILARKIGSETRARSYATYSCEQFTKLREKYPRRADIAVAKAKCHIFLEQFPPAIEVLNDALASSQDQTERAEIREVIANSYAHWVETINLKPFKTTEDRVEILRILGAALALTPGHEVILHLIADQVLGSLRDTDPEVIALSKSLVRGSSPGISHFIIGTGAMLRGDDAAGLVHLEIAAQTMPHSDMILNNLACVIAKRQDGDLRRALKLVETAIRRSPKPSPYFLDTRGQVLCKLGRWQDAIPDLEAVLPVPPLALEAHRSLAQCFAELGSHQLSAQHQSEVARLEAAKRNEEKGSSP